MAAPHAEHCNVTHVRSERWLWWRTWPQLSWGKPMVPAQGTLQGMEGKSSAKTMRWEKACTRGWKGRGGSWAQQRDVAGMEQSQVTAVQPEEPELIRSLRLKMPHKGPSEQGLDSWSPWLAPADLHTSETALRAIQKCEGPRLGSGLAWLGSATYETCDLRQGTYCTLLHLSNSRFALMIQWALGTMSGTQYYLLLLSWKSDTIQIIP